MLHKIGALTERGERERERASKQAQDLQTDTQGKFDVVRLNTELAAQVELQVLRSFYKEQGKSPFPKLPWKTGSLHFRFLPVRSACAAISYTPTVSRASYCALPGYFKQQQTVQQLCTRQASQPPAQLHICPAANA